MPFAARLGDPLACPIGGAGAIGPPCCLTVNIGNQPAARVGDSTTAHQARIILPCCPTVNIGG